MKTFMLMYVLCAYLLCIYAFGSSIKSFNFLSLFHLFLTDADIYRENEKERKLGEVRK